MSHISTQVVTSAYKILLTLKHLLVENLLVLGKRTIVNVKLCDSVAKLDSNRARTVLYHTLHSKAKTFQASQKVRLVIYFPYVFTMSTSLNIMSKLAPLKL